ncbi:MAG: MoaD/ThiS family protein [Myxococcales bacterium]|nr:MoaD/ThiS family protein [Myxococcales bacterium]
MPTLLIPPVLRPFTNGLDRVEVAATTVDQAVGALEERFPEAGTRLRQAVARRYVIMSIDGQDVRDHGGGQAALSPTQELHLLWAVAGG